MLPVLELLCILSSTPCVLSDLKGILKHYTPLHKDDIKYDHKPSGLSVQLLLNKKKYTVLLVPDQRLFHNEFTVEVHSLTNISKLHNPTEGHYVGHIKGFNSHILLHLYDGIITGILQCQDDIWHIEPSFRHIKKKHSFHMIAYRESDFLHRPTQACGHSLDTNAFDYESSKVDRKEHAHNNFHRAKRDSYKKSCSVMLVIDYEFFFKVAQSKEVFAKGLAVSVFQKVASILEHSTFKTDGVSFSGYTIQLKKIIIHKEKFLDIHYNGKHPDGTFDGWKQDIQEHLKYFGFGRMFHQYCLVHLYTGLSYYNNLFGFSYVASPKVYVY